MTGHPAPGDGPGGPAAPPPVWREAPDGGRTVPRRCAHLDAPAGPGPVPGAVCAACAARHRTWRRLRWCATCGYVGCCDSSPGAHAHAHHLATGHPVAVSLAPDEDWAWCFADELFLVPVTAPRDASP